MAKKNDIVEYSVKFGLLGSHLPPFQLYVVYARNRTHGGFAIFGATTKKDAKEQAINEWLETAKVYLVDTFHQYCERFEKNTEEEYQRLINKNLLPNELNQWFEIEWGS